MGNCSEQIDKLQHALGKSPCARCGSFPFCSCSVLRPANPVVGKIEYDPPILRGNPYKCPCCDGYGHRANAAKTQMAPCKSCNGTGILWGS